MTLRVGSGRLYADIQFFWAQAWSIDSLFGLWPIFHEAHRNQQSNRGHYQMSFDPIQYYHGSSQPKQPAKHSSHNQGIMRMSEFIEAHPLTNWAPILKPKQLQVIGKFWPKSIDRRRGPII